MKGCGYGFWTVMLGALAAQIVLLVAGVGVALGLGWLWADEPRWPR